MSLIHLKLVRTKSPLFAGSNTVRTKEAEMVLDTHAECVLMRRRTVHKEELIIPVGHVEYMEPLLPIQDVFTNAPIPAPSLALPVIQSVVPDPRPSPEDVVRFVKIKGQIVERKGEKLPDELKAQADAAMEARAIVKAQEAQAELELEIATRPTPSSKKKPSTIAEMLAGTIAEDTEEVEETE